MAQITKDERARRRAIVARATKKVQAVIAEACNEFGTNIGDVARFRRAGLPDKILDVARERWTRMDAEPGH